MSGRSVQTVTFWTNQRMLTFPLSRLCDPPPLPAEALQQYWTYNEGMISCEVQGEFTGAARTGGLTVAFAVSVCTIRLCKFRSCNHVVFFVSFIRVSLSPWVYVSPPEMAGKLSPLSAAILKNQMLKVILWGQNPKRKKTGWRKTQTPLWCRKRQK